MTTQAIQKLDFFRRVLDEQVKNNKVAFKLLAAACEHRIDNSGRHGMYAQIDVCKASGIRTRQCCDITTCPVIH